MRAAFYECDITPPIGGFMWGHYKMTTASYSSGYSQLATLHNNKGNLLFVDGHSASMTAYEVATGVKSISGNKGADRIERFCMGKWGATYNKMIRNN